MSDYDGLDYTEDIRTRLETLKRVYEEAISILTDIADLATTDRQLKETTFAGVVNSYPIGSLESWMENDGQIGSIPDLERMLGVEE